MITFLLIALLTAIAILLFGIVYCSALLMAGIFEALDDRNET